MPSTRTFVAAAAAIALCVFPFVAEEFRVFQALLIASTAIISLGLVVLTGVAGQISLAQAGFAAVGAYGSTILALRLGIAPWVGIPILAVVSAAFGYGLGLLTLRVAGHYLALATLALTATIQVFLVHWDSMTGGAAGLAVPPLKFGNSALTSAHDLYMVVMPLAVLIFIAVFNLLRSRFGRALMALRESEVAAGTLGLNVLHYKSLAFAICAFLGAIGGGIQALQTGYLDPTTYGIVDSVLYLSVIVIGGFRSVFGVLTGSAVFVLVPEMLGSFQAYKGVVFGVLLLLIILTLPNGLSGLSELLAHFRRRRS